MITSAVRQYHRLLIKSLFKASNINLPKYSPPPSQFEDFSKHIENIDNLQSRKAAAELLARLETDEEIYKEKLISIEEEMDFEQKENSYQFELLTRAMNLQSAVNEQRTENKEIEARCMRDIDNIKIYGISRIAKDVIETVDHFKQAIKIIEASNAENRLPQVTELKRTLGELAKLLDKYEIHEFSPVNQPFNPNEQESIGQIATEQPEKKNLVAQVQRTGFKIKQRLLRPAFVVIYI